MNVAKLIEKLQEVDPSAQVTLEGETDDVAFSVREVIDDDNGAFIMLLRGEKLPVIED